MLNIYHSPRTRGFRVIWLCEELGIPYKVTPVDFAPAYRATPEWRSKNPVGKVPVMTDGELSMCESGAMVEYVLDKFGGGRLRPARATAEHALYLQWSWFAEATFARPLGEIVNHKREFTEKQSPEIIEEMKNRSRLCAQAVDNALSGKSWILGETFSAADIMLGYTLRLYGLLMDEALPDNVGRYWANLTGRAAYKTAEATDMGTCK